MSSCRTRARADAGGTTLPAPTPPSGRASPAAEPGRRRLGIVTGGRASHVEEAGALDQVAGRRVVNDASEREHRVERGGTRDKGCGTFGPAGPWPVAKDEVPDPRGSGTWLDVDGERRQTGSTRTMIFGVAGIVSHLGRFMALPPGGIATTGAPPGVDAGEKPQPVLLKPGDVMTPGIDGPGERRQDVVSWRRAGEG